MSAAKKRAGRSPAHQAGATRQDMWLALKRLPGAITVASVAEATGAHRSSVLRYFNALTAGGYLEASDVPNGLPMSWSLKRDVGHHAPRLRADGSAVTQGEVVAQLWCAMLGLKDGFDFRELMQGASIDIPEETAKDYCKRLLAAGYLRVLVKADPHAKRIARYRLIRASGPQAPQVQRVRQIFDPNTGEVYRLEAGL